MDHTQSVFEAYARLRNGDHLKDADLILLIDAIESALPFIGCHPHFALVRNQANTDLEALKGFFRARKNR